MKRVKQHSQALFQNILDTASDAILSVDEEQHIVMFNLQAEQIFGYKSEEILGKPLSLLLPQRYALAHKGYVDAFGQESAHRRLMSTRSELAGVRKDGSEFPVDISISKVTVSENKRLYTAIVRDVTKRQKIEKALQQTHDELEARVMRRTEALNAANTQLLRSEEKFRAMFENSVIGMVTCEDRGHKVQANRAFCDLFGYSTDEVLEYICFRLIAGDDYEDLEEVLAYFDDNGVFGPIEKECAHRDGTLIPVQLKGLFYRDSDDIPHIWLFVEDIRVQKGIQKRLMQSSKLEAIGELAANIAHEMNNPLGIISAKARLLLFTEKDSMSVKVSTELSKIIEQTDRLSRLTRGLLDYSRPSFGMKGPVDIRQPLRKALDIVGHRCKTMNVEIVEDLGEEALMVQANSHELEQVFLNFFLNANDAMPEGGTLSITARKQEPNDVVVVVKDTGEGMSPEVQAKIFEPFYTTKEEGRGTGLGLSVCFGLVRSHDGSIVVDSTPGEGSQFTLTLPSLKEG